MLTSLLAAPELSTCRATGAAGKCSCPLRQLLSAAPARLLNRLVQICLPALPKAQLILPMNRSHCALCNETMPSSSLGPLSTDSQARTGSVHTDAWMDKCKYVCSDQPRAFSFTILLNINIQLDKLYIYIIYNYKIIVAHTGLFFAERYIRTGFCYWKYEQFIFLKLKKAQYYFAASTGKK